MPREGASSDIAGRCPDLWMSADAWAPPLCSNPSVDTVVPASSEIAPSGSIATEVVTQWRGAKGQTPFWAEPDIMAEWNLEISDNELLKPCSCLWKPKTSDDAIFSGSGEAGGVVRCCVFQV